MKLAFELRGIRNHNPGNIDFSPENSWLGLDTDKPSDGRFCRFKSPEWGIRAMARILRNYQKRDGQAGVGGPGIDTVQEIIHRWAPPVENQTDAYVRKVAGAIGKRPTEPLDMTDPGVMAEFIAAIIRHENGIQPYSMELIKAGIALA